MVDGDLVGPDRGEQFLLGHHLAGVPQQQRQHPQRLVLHLHRQPAHAQFVACLVELGVAEPPAVQVVAGGSGMHGRIIACTASP